jgi:Ricin-type beta-trefoil lectin domain-like
MNIRRGIAALVACAVAVVVAMSATQASANESTDPIKNRAIPLINYGSGKCFEPTPQDGHTELAGLPIQQRTCVTGRWLQSYTFQSVGVVLYNESGPWIHLGTEGYFIRNPYTELCLDARDGSRSDQSVVQQSTCLGANDRSMVWYVEKGDFPGHILIRNLNSDLCLDVASGSSDEYAQLQQYHCTSSNLAQNFRQASEPGFELVVQFVTGSDDLRGGNDNVHVFLLLQSVLHLGSTT